MSDARRKYRAAVIATSTATILAGGKLAVGVMTGSLAVVAAALDSLMDVACSGLNAFFLHIARTPPDAEHAFGHGKAEALSGVVQATIIASSGVWLIGGSVARLVSPKTVQHPLIGALVAGASLVVSLVLVSFLRREARATRSIALQADAFHYVTDIVSNLVAGAALLGVRWLGWAWLDPIASLLIAAYIIKSAVDILHDAADELLDRGLPREVEDEIVGMVADFAPEIRGFRAFRSRRAGGTAFFEFRLLVDRTTSFERSHEIAEALIAQIRRQHGDGTQVMIDTDPA